MAPLIISGYIAIPDEIRNTRFKVYIRLLDTSYLDAPATTLALLRISNVKKPAVFQKKMPFELIVEKPLDPSHDYSLAVLIDMDGDGNISAGDFIHRQNYSVVTHNRPQTGILVELQKV
jgi:uncharacterized lipoprotein YbaY